MGRRSLGIAAVASIVCGLGLALAAASGASHRSDRVIGVARNTFPGGGPNRLEVDARSSARGLNPGGLVQARGDLDGAGPMEPFRFKGRVTCLRVVGNQAAIKYRFAEAEGGGAQFEGGGVQIFIEDNGEPSGGQAVDANAFDPPQTRETFRATEDQCDDPTARPDYDDVDSSDYTVRDRQPRPASSAAPRTR